jgi:hypothetical protein
MELLVSTIAASSWVGTAVSHHIDHHKQQQHELTHAQQDLVALRKNHSVAVRAEQQKAKIRSSRLEAYLNRKLAHNASAHATIVALKAKVSQLQEHVARDAAKVSQLQEHVARDAAKRNTMRTALADLRRESDATSKAAKHAASDAASKAATAHAEIVALRARVGRLEAHLARVEGSTERPMWRAYLQAVYGDDTPTGDLPAPQALQLLYTRVAGAPSLPDEATTPCHRLTGFGDRACGSKPTWASVVVNASSSIASSSLRPPTRTEDLLVFNALYRPPPTQTAAASWNRSDHEWVEVTRFAGGCGLWKNIVRGDGRLPAAQGARATAVGCWFFLARGSGAFVNVGRVLRFATRVDAADALGESAAGPARTLGAHGHVPGGKGRTDDHWCAAALAAGYDSVLVGVEHASGYVQHASRLPRQMAELAVCHGPCRTRWYPNDPCTDLPLRTGAHADRQCRCDKVRAVLNCGRRIAGDTGCQVATGPLKRVRQAMEAAARG